MRKKAEFSVHFYLRPYEACRVIWAYVSLRGQKSKLFSTGIKVVKGETWIPESRTVKGNPESTQLLRLLESDLHAVFLSFRSAGIVPTPDEVVKKHYGGGAVQAVLLKDFLQDYYDTEAEKEGYTKETSTIESYRAKIKALYGFLQAKGWQDITLREITPSFGDELVHYLETVKRYSAEHKRKIVQLLKRALNKAVKKGLIVSNPIDVRFHRKAAPAPVFLSPDEFNRFAALQPVGNRLKKARDLFIWQCYTGHSFADMRAFCWEKHVEYFEGQPFVCQVRKKMRTTTQETAKFPLLPEAVAIWKKYGNTLPRLSAQQYNNALKELADMAGISKKVTSHAARRTAGRLWLNTGVSMEVVAAMLGHSDIRTTQKIYASIDFSRIHRETQILFNKKADAATPALTSESV